MRRIFERQWIHVGLLGALVGGLAAIRHTEGLLAGEFWGLDTKAWFLLAVGVAVAHQVFVWFCWRTQLHASLLTRTLGSAAFTVYAVVFSVLGIARIVSVFLLAIANHGTAPGNPIVLKLLALTLLIPAFYLVYSVRRYFGFKRAFGIDHFDESYRSLPPVRDGIFRYTSNGMYAFGFLLIWFPGLWYASLAALAAALFSHLYIWVHYYCTERPDMQRIYGDVGST